MSNTNIVENWLHSINLSRYSKAFIDNGYDDLEVCKLIDLPDLHAIGVDTNDRGDLLEAVRTLREEGGTAVYFTLELLNRSIDDGDDVDSDVDGRNQIETRHFPDECNAGKTTPEIPQRVRCLWQPTTVGVRNGKRYSYIDPSSIESEREIDEFTSRCQTVRPCNCSPNIQAASETGNKRCSPSNISKSMKELEDGSQTTSYSTMVTAGTYWSRSDVSRLYSPKACHSKSCFSLGPKRQQHRRPLLQPPAVYCYGDTAAELEQVSPKPGYHSNRNHDSTPDVQLYRTHCQDCGAARKGDGKWTARNGERRENGKRRNMAFSKLFTFRKSHKPMYRSMPGDLRASDITMSESDRIQLMLMVKEGKISTEEAVAEVKHYEEKVHEDFLRDMEVTHASEVKVPVCLSKSNKGSLLDMVRRSVHRLKLTQLMKARSKSVMPVDDGYLVPQCCCTTHRLSVQAQGHTDCPQQFDHSNQCMDWPWHQIGLAQSRREECGTVTSNGLDNHHYPSCHMSQASLLPWQQSRHASHASLLPWQQSRCASQATLLPCQKSRHASQAAQLPCQQSRHTSHASLLPWQQSRHASHASLLPCQHSRHASQATLLPWQQSRHASQATLLPWQESMRDMRRLSADICDSCQRPTLTHQLDTLTQRWSAADCPVSQLCSYCHNSMCHHTHCHHQYCPPGCSTSAYCNICDNVHQTCAMIHECDSMICDHKPFSPSPCSCGETTSHKPRWQHSHQPNTQRVAAPPPSPCYNSIDSLPSYSDIYSGTINPDFISMISLNSPTTWESCDTPCCQDDSPKIQRLENFGTETQCVGWEVCWDAVGSSPLPPVGRRDERLGWRPNEMQSVPDMCHQSHLQMPASGRPDSVDMFTDVEEEEEAESGKTGRSGHSHVPMHAVSSGLETDDERSLHNAMSHLNVDTNKMTEDKGTQHVFGDSDIIGDTDTTVSVASVRGTDVVVNNKVSVNQVNTTDDTNTVHVTGDNSVSKQSFRDANEAIHNYTLVGGGIQCCSPLEAMDAQQECCPLVLGEGKHDILGADLVALRDSGCYDTSQNSSLDGNLPISASYPNIAVGRPADICSIPKYSSWATS